MRQLRFDCNRIVAAYDKKLLNEFAAPGPSGGLWLPCHGYLCVVWVHAMRHTAPRALVKRGIQQTGRKNVIGSK